MCGINAIIFLKENLNQDDVGSKISVMNNSIIHRGPDSDGLYISNNVALGFRRLSIIDLSTAANQPMKNADGTLAIVFNGEIYNYIEIYEELKSKGHVFYTKSDTEVILNAYKEWGVECVHKFNGMWAFVIHDVRDNSVFISRDRLGVKPLYYHINENYVVLSSELKAIISAENLRSANKTRVYEYLAYGYNKTGDGETFIKEIMELLPGTNMIVKNNSIQIKTYWELKAKKNNNASYDAAKLELRKLFEDAVRIRYRSDVPLALLLSGGIDSTAIAAITEHLKAKGILDQTSIEAFTVHFAGFIDDELSLTKSFAESCPHIHLNVLEPELNKMVKELRKIIYDLDMPLTSFSHIIHNQMMEKIHENGIKVAINGQGSDEAFYGYDKHIFGYYLMDRLIERKGDFMKQLKQIHSHLGFSYSGIISQMFKVTLNKTKASFLRAKHVEGTIDCLDKKFVEENYKHFNYNYAFSLKGKNLSNYAIEQISHTGLNTILHYEDVSSMRHSIEMRSPFMDYRIIEFAFSIPDEYKFDMAVSKKILRDTFSDLLPENIVKNPKKIGFSSPFIEYMKREDVKQLINETINSESFNSKKIWNQNKIRGKFNNPEKYPDFPFWRFLNFEIWSNEYSISGL